MQGPRSMRDLSRRWLRSHHSHNLTSFHTMDSAYDHIQEESYPQDQPKKQTGESSSNAPPSNFNTEVQEAYKAISSSPWAARLGGFWQTAKKQVGLDQLAYRHAYSDTAMTG